MPKEKDKYEVSRKGIKNIFEHSSKPLTLSMARKRYNSLSPKAQKLVDRLVTRNFKNPKIYAYRFGFKTPPKFIQDAKLNPKNPRHYRWVKDWLRHRAIVLGWKTNAKWEKDAMTKDSSKIFSKEIPPTKQETLNKSEGIFEQRLSGKQFLKYVSNQIFNEARSNRFNVAYNIARRLVKNEVWLSNATNNIDGWRALKLIRSYLSKIWRVTLSPTIDNTGLKALPPELREKGEEGKMVWNRISTAISLVDEVFEKMQVQIKKDNLRAFESNFPKFSQQFKKELQKEMERYYVGSSVGQYVEEIKYKMGAIGGKIPIYAVLKQIEKGVLSEKTSKRIIEHKEGHFVTGKKEVLVGGIDLLDGKFKPASSFSSASGKAEPVDWPIDLIGSVGFIGVKLAGRYLLKTVAKKVGHLLQKKAIERGLKKSTLEIEKKLSKELDSKLGERKTSVSTKSEKVLPASEMRATDIRVNRPRIESSSTKKRDLSNSQGELLIIPKVEDPSVTFMKELNKLVSAKKTDKFKPIVFKNKVKELIGEAGAKRYILDRHKDIKELLLIPRRGTKGAPILDIVFETKSGKIIVVEAKGGKSARLGKVLERKFAGSDSLGTGEVAPIKGEISVQQMSKRWLQQRINEIFPKDHRLSNKIRHAQNIGNIEGYTIRSFLEGGKMNTKMIKNHTIEWNKRILGPKKKSGDISATKEKQIRDIKRPQATDDTIQKNVEATGLKDTTSSSGHLGSTNKSTIKSLNEAEKSFKQTEKEVNKRLERDMLKDGMAFQIDDEKVIIHYIEESGVIMHIQPQSGGGTAAHQADTLFRRLVKNYPEREWELIKDLKNNYYLVHGVGAWDRGWVSQATIKAEFTDKGILTESIHHFHPRKGQEDYLAIFPSESDWLVYYDLNIDPSQLSRIKYYDYITGKLNSTYFTKLSNSDTPYLIVFRDPMTRKLVRKQFRNLKEFNGYVELQHHRMIETHNKILAAGQQHIELTEKTLKGKVTSVTATPYARGFGKIKDTPSPKKLEQVKDANVKIAGALLSLNSLEKLVNIGFNQRDISVFIDSNRSKGFTDTQIGQLLNVELGMLNYLKDKFHNGSLSDTINALKTAKFDLTTALSYGMLNKKINAWEKANPDTTKADIGTETLLKFLELSNRKANDLRWSLLEKSFERKEVKLLKEGFTELARTPERETKDRPIARKKKEPLPKIIDDRYQTQLAKKEIKGKVDFKVKKDDLTLAKKAFENRLQKDKKSLIANMEKLLNLEKFRKLDTIRKSHPKAEMDLLYKHAGKVGLSEKNATDLLSYGYYPKDVVKFINKNESQGFNKYQIGQALTVEFKLLKHLKDKYCNGSNTLAREALKSAKYHVLDAITIKKFNQMVKPEDRIDMKFTKTVELLWKAKKSTWDLKRSMFGMDPGKLTESEVPLQEKSNKRERELPRIQDRKEKRKDLKNKEKQNLSGLA